MNQAARRVVRIAWRCAVIGGGAGAMAATCHGLVNAGFLRRAPQPTPAPVSPPAQPGPPGSGPGRTTPVRVSVLIPARDEASGIEACLRAVRGQQRIGQILVADDSSADATAALARRALSGDERAQVIELGGRRDPGTARSDSMTSPAGTRPPPGWLGKTWACEQLARRATEPVLIFIDADVLLAPGAIPAIIGLLAESGLDVVCPYPRQLADGALPRLIQPLLQWSWLTFLPLRVAERSSRPSLTAANGQLLAVRAGAYWRAGGHASVRGEVLEDLALVRAIKAAGGRGGVTDGTSLATCRMYSSGTELADGYSKSLWRAFGTRSGAAATMAGLWLLYLVPPVAIAAGPARAERVAGSLGYCAAVAGRVAVARRTGQRLFPDVLAHPASIAALTWLTAVSWRRHDRGELSWKGRPVR